MIVWCDFCSDDIHSAPIDTALLSVDLRERVEDAARSGYRVEFTDQADYYELHTASSTTKRKYPMAVSGHIGTVN